MVDVTNRPDVAVRLRAREFLFAHGGTPWIARSEKGVASRLS
jgi:hypothetical protein